MKRIPKIDFPLNPFLPVVVIGYEVHGELPEIANPRGLWTLLEHQTAGFMCLHRRVVGFVLRFEGNAERAIHDPAPFFAALNDWADLNDLEKLRRDFPYLAPLTPTDGDRYDAPRLEALHRFVSGFFPIPPFVEGEEAFVRFDGDPLGAFQGWRISDGTADVPLDGPLIASLRARLYPQIADLCRDPDARRQSWLARIIGTQADEAAPKAYFLWHNSD